jgi:hypothetical protein
VLAMTRWKRCRELAERPETRKKKTKTTWRWPGGQQQVPAAVVRRLAERTADVQVKPLQRTVSSMLRARIRRHSSAMLLALDAGMAGGHAAADCLMDIGCHAAAQQVRHCSMLDVAQTLMPERGRQQLGLVSSGQAVLLSRCADGGCSASLQSTASPQAVEVVGLVQVSHSDDLLAAPNDAQ